MSLIPTSYGDLISNAAKQYLNYVPASALFSNDSGVPGLLIESVELLKEFVSKGVEFGMGPPGLLFYSSSSDLGSPTEAFYKVFYNDEHKRAIKVDFYPNRADFKPFATFITRDDSVQISALKDGKGDWRDIEIGMSTAKVHKPSSSMMASLTMAPLEKKIVFLMSSDVRSALDTRGTFYFPRIADLNHSSFVVHYNKTRIVFYSSTDKTKMLGVFYPAEGKGLESLDNSDDLSPPTATWEDL